MSTVPGFYTLDSGRGTHCAADSGIRRVRLRFRVIARNIAGEKDPRHIFESPLMVSEPGRLVRLSRLHDLIFSSRNELGSSNRGRIAILSRSCKSS